MGPTQKPSRRMIVEQKHVKYKCRECLGELFPTPKRIAASNFICNPCYSLWRKAYVKKRALEGNPVVQTAEYKKKYSEAWRKSLEAKESKRKAGKKYRSSKEYAVNQLARNAVQRAVASGKLVRLPCEVCGNPKTHGHHDDYSKRLEVKWLCHDHHMARHAELRRLK